MITLGITGNIGSGKSTVLKILSKKSINAFDLDKIAKDFYISDNFVYSKILENFPGVLSSNNQIDTKKLGQMVFNDHEKLKTLQEIIWPKVEKEIINKIQNSTSKIIAFEGAVIIEANWHKLFDHIWIIDSNQELSKEKVLKNRNLSENDFEKILNHQYKINEMIDILNKDNIEYSVINNDSSLNELNNLIEKEIRNLII